MNQIKVLFLCVPNSARSHMAEAYLKKFGGDKFQIESAGLEPGKFNPLAIQVMKEKGIDISKNPPMMYLISLSRVEYFNMSLQSAIKKLLTVAHLPLNDF